jgi:hypothetical protein
MECLYGFFGVLAVVIVVVLIDIDIELTMLRKFGETGKGKK